MQAKGEFAQIQQILEPALDLPGQPVKRGTMAHEHIVYMMLADGAALARDPEGLERYNPKLMELAKRDHHRPYLAIAQRAAGVAKWLAGEKDKARSELHGALNQFLEINMHWQAGRTLHDLGQLELEAGAQEDACDYFRRALEVFEQMGAKPAAKVVSTTLGACS
jgi:hypothetical protein